MLSHLWRGILRVIPEISLQFDLGIENHSQVGSAIPPPPSPGGGPIRQKMSRKPYDVLAAVNNNIIVFWEVPPCSLVY
jgi:hypothetical protein